MRECRLTGGAKRQKSGETQSGAPRGMWWEEGRRGPGALAASGGKTICEHIVRSGRTKPRTETGGDSAHRHLQRDICCTVAFKGLFKKVVFKKVLLKRKMVSAGR